MDGAEPSKRSRPKGKRKKGNMDKNELRAEIYKRMSQYPQYDHYYDDDKGWKFALAVKKISFKSGDILPGEYMLIRDSGTVGDTRNGEDVRIPAMEIVHLIGGFMEQFGHWYPESAVNCLIEKHKANELIFTLE